jgi:hypothetical protein
LPPVTDFWIEAAFSPRHACDSVNERNHRRSRSC